MNRILPALIIAIGVTMSVPTTTSGVTLDTALFAGGCFWCMEPPFDNEKGVLLTEAGYSGGNTVNPTYEDVCTGKTGHAEVIRVFYDPSQVTYKRLLEIFWRNIDPTTKNQQFADRGSQYRTAIFYLTDVQKKQALASKEELDKSGKYTKPIVTEITKAGPFYVAEEHHQDYYKKNSIHYNMYKQGSGRADYIKKMWGEGH